MKAFSSVPVGQPEPRYDAIARAIERNLRAPSRRPLEPARRELLEREVGDWVNGRPDEVIVDTGCGTGLGSVQLAKSFPDLRVLGIDKSEVRIEKEVDVPSNCRLVRAELSDFWTWASEKQWVFRKQFFLYPNPWPKSVHFKKRWHGHVSFPDILATSSEIELRTNWEVYAQEFAFAIGHVRQQDTAVEAFEWRDEPTQTKPLTRFEQKYSESGHALWRVRSSTRI